MGFIYSIRNFVLRLLYRFIIKPLIFLWEPEDAHDKMKAVGKFFSSNFLFRGFSRLLFSYRNKRLNTVVDGVKYANPIGLSAGFDKDGELTKMYPCISFGFAELGSFTGQVCPGNPGRRLWRLKKSRSILVWYGLNNQGADRIAKRLAKAKFKLPIGISAAKTNNTDCFDIDLSIKDYMTTYRAFRDIGHYYTINISCPNTQDGEPFADPVNLGRLFDAINAERVPNKPVYVKIAADMPVEEVNAIVDTVLKYKIDGMVLANLTKPRNSPEVFQDEVPYPKGAMSGMPLQKIATNLVRHIYQRSQGRFTIIAVGGIFTARDAYEKITSGANLCQMITGMIFDGPQVMAEINQGLVKFLKKDGLNDITEAVGFRNPLDERFASPILKQPAFDQSGVVTSLEGRKVA